MSGAQAAACCAALACYAALVAVLMPAAATDAAIMGASVATLGLAAWVTR